jgi:Sec-independent protein translocase protein TatA
LVFILFIVLMLFGSDKIPEIANHGQSDGAA